MSTAIPGALAGSYSQKKSNRASTPRNIPGTVVLRDANGAFDGIASSVADNAITSAKIANDTIVDADIKSDAAIAGTKIAPDFGSQDITIGDKIIHSGDTNTAIRFPANDTVTVETVGSERMRINSSGFVGINSNDPKEHLHVSGEIVQPSNNFLASNLYFDGAWKYLGNGTGGFIKLSDALNRISIAVAAENTAGADAAATVETAMVILPNRNVGIGTTSPTCALDVRSTGLSSASQRVMLNSDVSSISNFLTTDATVYISNTGAGDAGIHMRASAADYSIRATDSGELLFEDDGVERVRIKPAGQVRFQPLSADPSGAEAGDVYYNSSTNKLKVYNGTSWVDLH